MTDYERFTEYQDDNSRSSTVGFALTFLFIGLGIGALSALLFAPQSGKKMRKTLRRRYEDAVDSLGDLRDQAGDAFERGSDWAKGARETAREKVRPIARAVRRAD
jgi:gas vesicle protein